MGLSFGRVFSTSQSFSKLANIPKLRLYSSTSPFLVTNRSLLPETPSRELLRKNSSTVCIETDLNHRKTELEKLLRYLDFLAKESEIERSRINVKKALKKVEDGVSVIYENSVKRKRSGVLKNRVKGKLRREGVEESEDLTEVSLSGFAEKMLKAYFITNALMYLCVRIHRLVRHLPSLLRLL